MKSNSLLRTICLFVLIVSCFPRERADALVAAAPPPVDMFQLPWDQGIAWVAIDGIDNGSKRPATSSHNYKLGGAIDFAPKARMVTGENTSQYWVTAAAGGTVVATSSCYVTIAHTGGWITQYQFLGNIQVRLGDAVARNQRLAIIADGVRQPYCPGYQDINVPHLHFMLRPSIVGATFAGWEVKYNSVVNQTTFTKGSTTLGLYQPLLNVLDVATPTPTMTATGTVTATPTATASPTPTITGPYVSTSVDPQSIGIGGSALVTVRLNNVPAEGYSSAEITCSYSPNLFEVSNIQTSSLFGADAPMVTNGPGAQSFIVAIAGSNGNRATTSGTVFTFQVKGLQAGQTSIECRGRVSQGNNSLTEIPFLAGMVTIVGATPTATLAATSTPTGTQPSVTNTPTNTPTGIPGGSTQTPTPTATGTTPGDWIAFTNTVYGFRFFYPPQTQLGNVTNTYARLDLPFVAGTNLAQKYLEVVVAENAATCRSPLSTNSMMETSQTVVINGLTFLKQTGQDGSAGHINKWTAYSTSRNNVCVSLDFVLRAANPGMFSTPPPLYDEAVESAVFGQIVATYAWLDLPTATTTPTSTTTSTSTATLTPTATSSPTPTSTSTPTATPTGSAQNGTLAGHVIASKPVVIKVYDSTQTQVATTESLDGTFSLNVAPGTYTVVASAPGFLSAQRTVTLTAGETSTLPTISLLAGDIDGNNVINQLDALTIGMSYNSALPDAADLNDDGIINVLDLEQLAKNYRKTGPVAW